MKHAAEIVLVVDESGSMAHLTDDTIKSLNAFIETQQKVKGEGNLTIRVFDSGNRRVVREGAINTIKPLTHKDYRPNGGTPLLDAVGEAIIALGQKLEVLQESERPDQVMMVIVTDGQENDSRFYGLQKIKDMIKVQTDKYNWSFSFLGAGLEAFSQAADIGLFKGKAVQYNNTGKGYAAAMDVMSSNIASTRGAHFQTNQAFQASMDISDEQEQLIKTTS